LINSTANNTRITTTLVFLTVLAYAIVRYDRGPCRRRGARVHRQQALAVTAIACRVGLAIGPLVRMRLVDGGWMTGRKAFGVHGFAMATLHTLLTIATLTPVRYGKLHDASGLLTLEGGLVVLGGVLAIALLVVPAVTSASIIRKSMSADAWQRAQRLGLAALAIGFLHVAVLGWRSWLAPHTWAGGLPPLTSIAVAACSATFAIPRSPWFGACPRATVRAVPVSTRAFGAMPPSSRVISAIARGARRGSRSS
jgi:DMSO/TMAO reductase YedYZ heme-binding membrane subunit